MRLGASRVTPINHTLYMANIQLTGPKIEVISTVDSFIGNLPEFLGALLTDSRCIVAIAEFSDHRYVQFWLDSPTYFIAEVISNLNIGDSLALTETDEDSLKAIGWNEPSAAERPNWYRIGTSVAYLIEIISMTKRAVLEVLRESPANTVSIRPFEMARTTKNPEQCNQPR